MAVQRFRSPELWAAFWSRPAIYGYLAVWVLGIWATTRIWNDLNSAARWMLAAIPAIGVISLPASALLLDGMHWQAVPKLQPLMTLRFTVSLSVLACLLAAFRSMAENKRRQTIVWFCLSAFVLVAIGRHSTANTERPAIARLARWAEAETWGGSMFLFADAGRAAYPGVFRADSWRPIWVDWEDGAQVNDAPSLATEWATRWQQAMGTSLSGRKVEALLASPIDYYVLKADSLLVATIAGDTQPLRWAFRDPNFVVYEANELRTAPGALRLLPYDPTHDPFRRARLRRSD